MPAATPGTRRQNLVGFFHGRRRGLCVHLHSSCPGSRNPGGRCRLPSRTRRAYLSSARLPRHHHEHLCVPLARRRDALSIRLCVRTSHCRKTMPLQPLRRDAYRDGHVRTALPRGPRGRCRSRPVSLRARSGSGRDQRLQRLCSGVFRLHGLLWRDDLVASAPTGLADSSRHLRRLLFLHQVHRGLRHTDAVGRGRLGNVASSRRRPQSPPPARTRWSRGFVLRSPVAREKHDHRRQPGCPVLQQVLPEPLCVGGMGKGISEPARGLFSRSGGPPQEPDRRTIGSDRSRYSLPGAGRTGLPVGAPASVCLETSAGAGLSWQPPP